MPLIRCTAKQAVAVAARVDISVDVRILSSEDMARMLSLTPNELRAIKRVDPELAKQVMSVAVVGWRPGSDAKATLRPAMAMGPGDGDKVMVQARAPRIPVPVVQSVELDCLDTSFLTNKHCIQALLPLPYPPRPLAFFLPTSLPQVRLKAPYTSQRIT